MQWIISAVLRFIDHAIQRALGPGNRAQTFGGITGGAAILAAIQYIETEMHCDLSQLKLAALWPLLHGAYATGAKTTIGDEQHVEQGGNSV